MHSLWCNDFNGEVDAVGGVVMMLKGENSNEVVNE
jgi:cobalt-zinc-cadmium resistance protein CzcA